MYIYIYVCMYTYVYIYIYIYIYETPRWSEWSCTWFWMWGLGTVYLSIPVATGTSAEAWLIIHVYVKLGTIQRILTWPLRKDDTHTSRSVIICQCHVQHVSVTQRMCLSVCKASCTWWDDGGNQVKQRCIMRVTVMHVWLRCAEQTDV